MNLERYINHPDRPAAFKAAAGALLARVGRPALRANMAPGMAELAAVAGGYAVDPKELLQAAGNGRFTVDRLNELGDEHAHVQSDLSARYASTDLPLPSIWSVETGTAFLLYALVRGLRPTTLIEVGVGNGHSTYVMLRALQANGAGRLTSFDVRPDSGALVPEDLAVNWERRLVSRRRSIEDLTRQLASLPRADLAFHDGDHGYLGQSLEFLRLWQRLSDRGVLVIDDVDASYGLIDFAAASAVRPRVLIDGRKAVGVVVERPSGA